MKGGENVLTPEEKTAIIQAVKMVMVNRIPPQELELTCKAIVVVLNKYDELHGKQTENKSYD